MPLCSLAIKDPAQCLIVVAHCEQRFLVTSAQRKRKGEVRKAPVTHLAQVFRAQFGTFGPSFSGNDATVCPTPVSLRFRRNVRCTCDSPMKASPRTPWILSGMSRVSMP